MSSTGGSPLFPQKISANSEQSSLYRAWTSGGRSGFTSICEWLNSFIFASGTRCKYDRIMDSDMKDSSSAVESSAARRSSVDSSTLVDDGKSSSVGAVSEVCKLKAGVEIVADVDAWKFKSTFIRAKSAFDNNTSTCEGRQPSGATRASRTKWGPLQQARRTTQLVSNTVDPLIPRKEMPAILVFASAKTGDTRVLFEHVSRAAVAGTSFPEVSRSKTRARAMSELTAAQIPSWRPRSSAHVKYLHSQTQSPCPCQIQSANQACRKPVACVQSTPA